MKFTSLVYASASGSVGGLVYSHNKGGLYTRARRVPVNPNSSRQQAVRTAMSSLAARWQGTLTDDQRQGWYDYAGNDSLVGSLGTSRNIGALGMYQRCNVPRIQAGLAPKDTPPIDYGPAVLTTPVVTYGAGNDVTVAFTNTDEWAGAVGGALLIYFSAPKSPTVRFFKGPYQLLGRINGAATPPTSPQILTNPNLMASGQRFFWRARAVQADGRISGGNVAGIATEV